MARSNGAGLCATRAVMPMMWILPGLVIASPSCSPSSGSGEARPRRARGRSERCFASTCSTNRQITHRAMDAAHVAVTYGSVAPAPNRVLNILKGCQPNSDRVDRGKKTRCPMCRSNRSSPTTATCGSRSTTSNPTKRSARRRQHSLSLRREPKGMATKECWGGEQPQLDAPAGDLWYSVDGGTVYRRLGVMRPARRHRVLVRSGDDLTRGSLLHPSRAISMQRVVGCCAPRTRLLARGSAMHPAEDQRPLWTLGAWRSSARRSGVVFGFGRARQVRSIGDPRARSM